MVEGMHIYQHRHTDREKNLHKDQCKYFTFQNTHIHTHSLTSSTALHAKPVSPQVVEKRVSEAWSQDGPGWLGSSRRLPPCVKMIMTVLVAPRPQRTGVEDLWRGAGVAGGQRFGSSGWRALSDTSGKLIVLKALGCPRNNGWRGSGVCWKFDEGNSISVGVQQYFITLRAFWPTALSLHVSLKAFV